MEYKKNKSFPLDSFAYLYLFFCIIGVFLAGVFTFFIVATDWTIDVKILLCVFVLLAIIIPYIFYNPFPFLLTRILVSNSEIALKRGKRTYTFNIGNVDEISLVKIKANKTGKYPVLHLCFSKKPNNSAIVESRKKRNRKTASEYIVNNEYFTTSIVNLEKLKPFLDNYKKKIIVSEDLANFKTILEQNRVDYDYLVEKISN